MCKAPALQYLFLLCSEFAQKYSASLKDHCFEKLGLKLNASFSDSLQASLCRMITSYEILSSGNANYSCIETSLKCQHSLQGNNSNHRTEYAQDGNMSLVVFCHIFPLCKGEAGLHLWLYRNYNLDVWMTASSVSISCASLHQTLIINCHRLMTH